MVQPATSSGVGYGPPGNGLPGRVTIRGRAGRRCALAPALWILCAALSSALVSDVPVRRPLQHEASLEDETVVTVLAPSAPEYEYRRPFAAKLSMVTGAVTFGLPYISSVLVAFAGVYAMGQVSLQGWGWPPVTWAPWLPLAVPVVGPCVSAAWIGMQPGHPWIHGIPYLLADAVAQALGVALMLYGSSNRVGVLTQVALSPSVTTEGKELALVARF